jgi:peptidoglycan/LPS O-acetylase OafA/YrhL
MDTEKLFLKQNLINHKRRNSLNYIAFIKFLAMIKIIKWHAFLWKSKPIDYGARMCEILFISSGFLVGYNHYKKNMSCDYETSFKYSYNHIRNFYPLLFINTIYGFFIHNRKIYNLTKFVVLISNLLMINSWSRHFGLASGFNDISWFLSALIFCYFFAPLLLQGIKNIKISLKLFLLILLSLLLLHLYVL